jgi:glycosyltransferase involved in cell wall biosynthesis
MNMAVNELRIKDTLFSRQLWQPARTSRAPLTMFVSSYVPSRCGLATFTHDLANAVDGAAGGHVSMIAAIQKHHQLHFSNPRVVGLIQNHEAGSYRQAAHLCNRHRCDIVSIQHEFGLYPGEWGDSILEFARTCAKPIVTTFHTLPLEPVSKARAIVQELAARSRRVVVMADTAIRILEDTYGVGSAKVKFIPPGVHKPGRHDMASLRETPQIRREPAIVTFRLLSPGKGIEYMIDAMPAIVRKHPRAVYLVAGATHPNVKHEYGEQYRESLIRRAEQLGVRQYVRFEDHFLSIEEVLHYIHVADVYVTPYTGKDQITSGSLAYALAAGKAIVSTPYLYAEEMAASNGLLLADFRNGRTLAQQILDILDKPRLRNLLETNAGAIGRTMLWDAVGKQYLDLFKKETAREFAQQQSKYERNDVVAVHRQRTN